MEEAFNYEPQLTAGMEFNKKGLLSNQQSELGKKEHSQELEDTHSLLLIEIYIYYTLRTSCRG